MWSVRISLVVGLELAEKWSRSEEVVGATFSLRLRARRFCGPFFLMASAFGGLIWAQLKSATASFFGLVLLKK